jgi:MoaA/NifB/PqqE/SkfB family radical SAM enzyme
VVTAKNYRDLPALARLLVKLGVDQYQLAFVHIVGTAWENRKTIVPKKTAVLPYIRKALDAGIKSGAKCYTEAVPFCLMAGYEECVAESVIPEGPVADADFYLENYADYRRNEGKAKRPECKACRWFAACEGPWKEYTDMCGWVEFKPVKKKPGD